jgi:hypothetical protein
LKRTRVATPNPAATHAAASPLSPERLAKVLAGLDKLSPEDRQRAVTQRLCPVQNKPLGLMGKPVELVLEGRAVFLCCASCEDEARADPKGMIKKLEEFKKLPPIVPEGKP